MGRGDKKTKRGKIFMGTYGNIRPHKTEQHNVKPATEVADTNKKKTEAAK